MRKYTSSQSTLSERLAPVWIGAICLAVVTSLRAALFLAIALVRGNFTDVGRAFLVVFMAAAGGAAGGLAYVLLGRPLRLVPRIGRYLAGIVTVAVYLGAILLMIEYIDPANGLSLRDRDGLYSYIVCTILFGIAVGHFWFGNLDPQPSD